MSPLVRFRDCDHSVFVSYAHADNEVYGNWVSDFASELTKDLAAELARVPTGRAVLPPVHLSEDNGPLAGELSEQLKARVARSFAVVVVVGRHYVDSAWCGQELAYFQQAFGNAGLNGRLYIVALAQEPITLAAAKPVWRQVFAGRNPVWQTYFEDDAVARPVAVMRDDGKAPTQAFARRFDRLRDDLVGKIKADLGGAQPNPQATRLLIGVGAPELETAIAGFAASARAHEPSVALLDFAALDQRAQLAARLRDAERLVLPFHQGQPRMWAVAGGQLAVLLECWRKMGKPDEQVFALDLSEVPPTEPAEPEHLEWLAKLACPKLLPAALLTRLFPPAAPAVVGQAVAAAARPVRLYIESNRNEPWQWKLLGEQIRPLWQKLLDERQIHVPLNLRPSGLNIDEIDLFNLDDADGLILLWGQKEARSLLSQINLVEDRLTELAPAIVAYLSPPKPQAEQAVPALGWQVLRFQQQEAPPPKAVLPEQGDAIELTRFLNDVLDRTSRRHKLSPV
ncbi:TIR domain-containing protein [Aquabacterium sp. OR-4]|uniref:TIR domain-containing protein n=1 Tax=Aquabacterium sp. OR-4 TaxID=2978127 RepID=UPI0021B3FBEB|nr:TIR domain-containing protein [Aquabacterium sp. OR-4]MDT7835699.1 TIR domain-containing protein [Aquabacterium sp. OR-4]